MYNLFSNGLIIAEPLFSAEFHSAGVDIFSLCAGETPPPTVNLLTLIKEEGSGVAPPAVPPLSPAVVCVCDTISPPKENKALLDFHLCLFKGVVVKYGG